MRYREKLAAVEAVQYQPGMAVPDGFVWVEVDLEHYIDNGAGSVRRCRGRHAEFWSGSETVRACPGDYVVQDPSGTGVMTEKAFLATYEAVA